VNRRTFIGSLCAVLTSPLWGKKAAEPAEDWIALDPKTVRVLRKSGHLRLDRGEWIEYTRRDDGEFSLRA
jgi:hypothetical protein